MNDLPLFPREFILAYDILYTTYRVSSDEVKLRCNTARKNQGLFSIIRRLVHD
jgi:hypothetical protein